VVTFSQKSGNKDYSALHPCTVEEDGYTYTCAFFPGTRRATLPLSKVHDAARPFPFSLASYELACSAPPFLFAKETRHFSLSPQTTSISPQVDSFLLVERGSISLFSLSSFFLRSYKKGYGGPSPI